MAPWIFDIAVIVVYFAVILAVGLFKGRREENLDDFALGGRSMPWWAVLSSIIAAETTAATFLGTPGEGYAHRNFTYVQLAIGTVLGRLLIGRLFLVPYFQYNVRSIYEFLAVRFGPVSKNAASALFLLTRMLASGTRLYVTAIIVAIAYRLAFPGVESSAAEQFGVYLLAIVAVTVLTAIYTSIGGIKAVIWTDCIQTVVMIVAALSTIGVLYYKLPFGFLSQFQGPKDLGFIDLGLDSARSLGANLKGVLESEYTLWAGLIANTFLTLATHGTDQDMVQRMLTAKNVKESRRSLWLSGLADVPIAILFLGIGILLWAFYRLHPDPGLPVRTNEVFCYFILTQLPAGIRGLVIAGLFATAMGSLSAAINALATSFICDWYIPFVRPSATDRQTLWAARVATVGFAVVMIVIASATALVVIHSPSSRIIPIVLGVFGYTYGSLLGIFLLGVLTPKGRGTDFGNCVGMVTGFVTVLVLSDMIAFPWRILFGSLATLAVAACFKDRSRRVGERES